MTTKLCDFCGKEIPENSKICPYCNKALENKVFTYMNQSKEKDESKLNVSKYLSSEKESSDNYFSSNIYSFSESEIERRFERKPVAYDVEESNVESDNCHIQREEPSERPRVRHRRKQKNLLYPVVGILFGIIVIICVIVGLASDSNDDKKEEVTTTVPTTSTTVGTTETTTEETTTTEATTTEGYISASSVDLDGYLGVKFSGVSDHFGEQTQNSASDEFYGGSVYYYDGMTISTDSNGRIASMTVNYSTVKNKDAYRYKEITYYSTYQQVVEELGTPSLNQMDDKTEPCIGYILDAGSGLSIKFKFDDNKKVSGFDMFYAD